MCAYVPFCQSKYCAQNVRQQSVTFIYGIVNALSLYSLMRMFLTYKIWIIKKVFHLLLQISSNLIFISTYRLINSFFIIICNSHYFIVTIFIRHFSLSTFSSGICSLSLVLNDESSSACNRKKITLNWHETNISLFFLIVIASPPRIGGCLYFKV